jgi:hypothetical protein
MQPGDFCGANVELAFGDVGAGNVQEGAQDLFFHMQLSPASDLPW